MLQCDEVKPACGNCAKGSRPCVYLAELTEGHGQTEFSRPTTGHEDDATRTQRHMQRVSVSNGFKGLDSPLQRTIASSLDDGDRMGITSPESRYTAFSSNGAELAPLRWLGLLANDANDVNLDLPVIEGTGTPWDDNGSPRSVGGTPDQTTMLTTRNSNSLDFLLPSSAPAIAPRSTANPMDETMLWRSPEALTLQDHEHAMFKSFVTGISSWIDLFDPSKHFSQLVPHLALRNVGLMKAVLALGARHLSLKPGDGRIVGVDQTSAAQYYSETLQYLQSAMKYTSYKTSSELLATLLILSTYEMLNGPGKDWERHLKAVFWIQRSREINGESGGLEQAIWWAWLRQDVRAAFRDRRQCFSTFEPMKAYSEMGPWGLANRVVYILGQAVNYVSDEEKLQGEADLTGRVTRAKQLLEMLDEWKQNTSVHFQPLPTRTTAGQAFEPIWIHPPAFGNAIQTYHMARILLLVHQPAAGGYLEYLGRDKTISDCIDQIGGIAMALTDDASRLVSRQCLYSAGLYCKDDPKREGIISLIKDHSKHSGWPANNSLFEELRIEWSNHGTG